VARVDGYQVKFTHRGSWKTNLWVTGVEPVVIPVAWKSDWNGKSLVVWFKTEAEADSMLARSERFRVAIAFKNANGSTSSNNIIAILWVKPVEKITGEHHPKLQCEIEARAKPSDSP
jgi:hypothetical protein